MSKAHPWQSLPLSRVVARSVAKYGYLDLGLASEISDAGLQACLVGRPNEPDSLTLQRVSSFLRWMNVFVVACYCTSTGKPSSAWLDLPSVLAEPPVRDRSDGLHWRLGYDNHQHRESIENLGNSDDYMKGRIRFMTAITPAYVHAYQATCLARHRFVHNPQREIVEPCTTHCRWCVGRQQWSQDEKHVIQDSYGAGWPQLGNDWPVPEISRHD